ncbi:MAG: sulfurtransferase [Fidelibacterota bacterium]|nr:MAG: sulfurtransferase [Candidatus Neomarinimicrobiota bacterium]
MRSGITVLVMGLLCWPPGLSAAAGGDTTHESLLVTTAWLAEHSDDPGLVLLHVGRKGKYEDGHIPGARFVSLRDLLTESPDGLHHEMPPLSELRAYFESHGISDDSQIVIYYAEDWGPPYAARAYLSLDYLGLGDRAVMLDGGLQQWLAEDRPVTTEIPAVEMGSITIESRADLFVNADWLEDRLRDPDVVIVDARPGEYYEGREKENKIARYGHITGAVSIPITDITLDDPVYRFKDTTTLEILFHEKGALPRATVVTYCNTGIWASLVYFTAKHLGYDARFYDGSFQDWTRDDNRPVIEPVKKSFLKRLFQ